MTVIVIPDTGKRTLTFRFTPVWLVLTGLLVVSLATASVLQHQANTRLSTQLKQDRDSVDTLRRTNRLQAAEIEALRDKVSATDEKLTQLESLETQLRQIAGQAAPSRSSELPNTSAVHSAGRGGPLETEASFTNLPTLSGMLPAEVRAYVFGKRDTLQMDLRMPEQQKQAPADTLATAESLNARAENQLDTMDRLAVDMVDSKQTILEQIDLFRHRPNGLPVTGLFTDRFGWRWDPFGRGQAFHEGLDIATAYWMPIVATADGVVIHSGWKSGGYGYTVIVDHGYGYVTMYAHMSDTKPEVGQAVRRGEVVGYVGSTGNSTGPHCHYEVHVNGVPVDPVKFMQ